MLLALVLGTVGAVVFAAAVIASRLERHASGKAREGHAAHDARA